MQTGQTKRFIPIQPHQIKRIWGIAGGKGKTKDDVYRLVDDINHFPSLRSMSRDEAECLIRKLSSPGNRQYRPKRPPVYKSDSIPHWYHVKGVRDMAGEYFNSLEDFHQWLKKYWKVDSIRELDLKKARGAYTALKAMTERKKKGQKA